MEVWPGDVRVLVRAGGVTVFRGLPRSCPGYAVVWEVSSWSARSRVAARTNELDADERRRIIGSEEGFLSCWWRGVVGVPGAWWAEWSRKHPFGVSPCSGGTP